ncbi:MAG: DUF2723 domain-containing protein [bacterium]
MTERAKKWLYPFNARDWLVAGLSALVSFAIYVYTAAPNVTLEDSGELITAAQHFGVPHPTGYPLWTLGAWLFTLLPLGNAAWEVNLFSGFCGALAVGLVALLLNNSCNWLLQKFPQGQDENDETVSFQHWDMRYAVSFLISLTFSLAFALSESMWTQCVIAEVYALHALLAMLFVCALYRWLHLPERIEPFITVIFFYTLGWSNHHLILAFTPVPLVLMVLLGKRYLGEFTIYLTLAASLIYMGFAWLSNDPLTPAIDDRATLHSSMRFFLCAIAALVVFIWIKRKLVHWRHGLLLLAVVAMGLLPYAYMPLASSTNPPMNWSYARERGGFFWAINRSQYSGSLSAQLLNTVGKLMGAQDQPAQPQNNAAQSLNKRLESIRNFSALYWEKIQQSFGWIGLICAAFAFALVLPFDPFRRAWILILFSAFLLAAFLEPFANQARSDVSGWALEMPYHTYSFALFTLIAGTGASAVSLYVLLQLERKKIWFGIAGVGMLAWLILPVKTGIQNAAACSQRDHWFGWQFGHDMLADLPQGSVFLGGTDPGRFVNTYMIFGESFQPPHVKRDPAFDRRDLYIITQNTLTDPFYLQYLRDQYTEHRPPVKSWFERWLKRDEMYPPEPLFIPVREDVTRVFEDFMIKAQRKRNTASPVQETQNTNIEAARMIFLKNKDKHRFFVEESFPMSWSYPYAIPHGLCYELAPEPLERIPEEAVKKDMQFWKHYTASLLKDPHFLEDEDARRSFSKLRQTTGNIYFSRGMMKEAETAYRQASLLSPSNLETTLAFQRILFQQKRHNEALALIEKAYDVDPFNPIIPQLAANVFDVLKTNKETQRLEAKFAQHISNKEEAIQLVGLLSKLGEFKKADVWAERALKELPKNAADFYQAFVNIHVQNGHLKEALELLKRWEKIQPNRPEIPFASAQIFLMDGNMEEFYRVATKAIQFGGLPMKERFASDPQFESLRNQEPFQALFRLTNSTTNAAAQAR